MSDGTSRVIWFKTDVDTSGMRSAADNILKLLNGLSNDVAKEVSKIQSTIESAFNPLNKTAANIGENLKTALSNIDASKVATEFNQVGGVIQSSFKGITKDIERIDTAIRQVDMTKWEKMADNYAQKLAKAQKQLENLKEKSLKIDISDESGVEKFNAVAAQIERAQEKVNKLSEATAKAVYFAAGQKAAEQLKENEKQQLDLLKNVIKQREQIEKQSAKQIADAQKQAAKEAAAEQKRLDKEAADAKKKLDKDVADAKKKQDQEAAKAADDLQKKLSKAFDEVNKEASKVETTLKQMSMSKLQKEADNYRIVLHDANKLLDDLTEESKKLNLTSQQQLEIQSKIRNTEERIEQLKKAQAGIISQKSAVSAGASAGAPPDFTKTADANANAQKRVNFILDDTTRLVRNLKTDLADLGRTVMQTFQMFATVVSVPTQAFGDFQKQLLIIKQLATDFTAKELTQFEETAKRVAVTNGIMATEIAKSGIELVRLGLNAKETNMALSQVADAALANSISIEKAAMIGLGTTKAFGLGVKDLSMVLDVLTRAAVSSATDIEGLGQTFKYAGPIFRSADQDINQLGIATAILSNNMIRNSQAGTTLRSMMVNLQKPTKEASKVLNELGVKVVDESTQKIRPFMDIVKDLSASMRNLTTDQKNASLAILFGKYALSGSSALINTTTEEVNRATKAFNDNALSAQKMAEGMRTGVNFSLDQMRASVNLAAIELGEKLAVSFQSVTNAVTETAMAFNNLPEGTQQYIADTIVMTGKTVLFTTAVTALILAFKTLRGFLAEIIPIIGSALTGAFAWATVQVGTLSAGISAMIPTISAASATIVGITGVIGVFVAGILAAIGVVQTFQEYWGAITAMAAEERAWEIAAEAQKNLTDRIKESNKNLETMISNYKALKNVMDLQPTIIGTNGLPITKEPTLEQRLAVAPKQSLTLEQIRSGLGALKTRTGLIFPQLSTAMEEFDAAKKSFDQLSIEISKQVDVSDPESIKVQERLKILREDYLVRMQKSAEILINSNQLDAQSLLLLKSDINSKKAITKQRNNQLEAIINQTDESKLAAKKEAAARKQQSALLEQVNSRLNKVSKEIEQEYQQKRQQLQSTLMNNKSLFTLRSQYGPRDGRLHAGTDYAARAGTPIFNEYAGKVISAGWQNGYGNTVDVALDNFKGVVIKYAHGLEKSFAVKVGEMVKEGQMLMRVGSTGRSTGPHLHREIRANGQPIDPAKMPELSPRFWTGSTQQGNEKDIRADIIAKRISALKKEAERYKSNEEVYARYNSFILDLENKRDDAANDAEQRRLQKISEIRDVYLNNIEAMYQMDAEISMKRAEMDKRTTEERIKQLEVQTQIEQQKIREKYGAFKEGNALVEQEEQKHQKRLQKLMIDMQAETQAQLEKEQLDYSQQGFTEAERQRAQYAKDIVDFQREISQLKTSGGPESPATIQNLQKLIELRNLYIKQSDVLIAYENRLFIQEKIKTQQQYNLDEALRSVNSAIMSQSEYQKMQLDMNNDLIADATINIDYLEKTAKGKMDESTRTRLLAAEQEKLNNLKQESYETTKKSLPFQLQEIKNKRAMGLIGQQESQAQVLEAYNNELDRLATISARTSEQQTEYNQILAARNELQLQVAQSTKDYTKIIDALIQKQYDVRNSADAVLGSFNGVQITGENLISALPDLESAFGAVGEAMVKVNPVIDSVMNGLNAVMSITMKFISGNPVMMIAGVVEGLAFIANILIDIFPSQEAVAQKNIELAESLSEVERKSRDAATELAYLRGEITEYDKQMRNRSSERQSMSEELDRLTKQRDAMKKSMSDFSEETPLDYFLQWNTLGIWGAFEKSELEKKKQELDAVSNKINGLSDSIKVFDAETSKESAEKAIERTRATADEYIKLEKAKAAITAQTVDDVDAEYAGLMEEQARRHGEELNAARQQGIDLTAIQQRQSLEWADIYRKRAEARLAATRADNSKLIDAEIDLQASLAALTPDKADDIRVENRRKRKQLKDSLNAQLAEIKGNSDEENKLRARLRATYRAELEKANKDELVGLEENEANKRQAYRETLLLEIQNSGDRRKILEQETKNELAALDDWKKGLEAAGEYSVDKQREYAAKRVEIERKAADKVKQFAVEQFNELKTIRQQILETQSKQYEQNILKQEKFLLTLNKERDDLQRQIEYYDAQIAKLKGEFNEQDKGLFQQLLGGVDLPAEIRKGLEFIANPTDVPNTRFSRQTQREAIKEQIDLLTLRNQNALDLEEISSAQYWKEESRIASIQGAAANAMLTDSVISAKLTAKEKLEIQKELADAYKRFQEAELKQIEDKYIAEKTANEKRLANLRLDEIERTKIIDDNKYQLDLLKQQYDKDINSIDLAMNKLNDSHKDLVFNLQDVQKNLGNMSPILNKITAEWQNLNKAMSGAKTSVGTSNTTSGMQAPSGGAPIPVVPGKTAPEGYNVTDGNYWYQTTSDMLGIGLKDGGILGMIPDQDKYRGDKFPIMPGVNGDAGELLVSPLDRLRDLMPSSNNFSIMVTGNVFQDDVDFERVMRNVFKEQNMRNSMSSGQFYSNLRR